MLKLTRKFNRALYEGSFFSTNQWDFKSSSTSELVKIVKESDKSKCFELDFSIENRFDWNDYILEFFKGIREFVLKDDMSSLNGARIKLNRLYWLQKIKAKYPSGIRTIVYNRIRSNTAGYKSKCTVHQPRKIGSGYITARIAVTGEMSVDFVETHVGHEDNIEYKRLTKVEETKIRDHNYTGFPSITDEVSASNQQINVPMRLLSTWHVIKNWNTQGRSKIKSKKLRDNMKNKMEVIMKETNEEKFIQYKEEYSKYLEEVGEYAFFKYLQTYYFQTRERVGALSLNQCRNKHQHGY
ncbi:hypothetical protein GWI33_019376 [Rhynchophorus ferrugineus]|uniref:Fatty acyl-CoA reductase C-terminal domain-containing protein n=1 Tax=Rhynchophorus ferrugineus TaxID=354439 RepID=A0A834HUS5_RHYFE|nr:hypothetical protein GWI33_019376 [Rhynchophorus ferrugineus]